MRPGRLTAVGTSTRAALAIIEATDSGCGCNLLLDRPLEVAVANDAAAVPGPYVSFNWAFNRDAFTLVSRPLPPLGQP